MSVVKRVTLLLLLLAVIGANADSEHCKGLKKLATEDLHKIFGDWVLVWSVADHERGMDLLPNVSSSHVELRQLPDNHTVTFTERNVYMGKKCSNYFINMSISSDHSDNHTMHATGGMMEKDGVFSPYNETGDVDFYETCADCMIMIYHEDEGRFLLVYRKEGQHRDVEQLKADHDDHNKMAECLGFTLEHPFIYDGAADFCHKKSSPEAEATEAPEHH